MKKFEKRIYQDGKYFSELVINFVRIALKFIQKDSTIYSRHKIFYNFSKFHPVILIWNFQVFSSISISNIYLGF